MALGMPDTVLELLGEPETEVMNMHGQRINAERLFSKYFDQPVFCASDTGGVFEVTVKKRLSHLELESLVELSLFSLARLHLIGCSLRNKEARLLASSILAAGPANVHLQMLDLRNNVFGEDGARAIAGAVSACVTLAHLQLSGELVPINVLKGKTNQQALDLDSKGFQLMDLMVIGRLLETNASLTRLSLRSNRLSADSAIVLANALKANTTLQALDISDGEIGDRGMAAIAAALERNRALTALHATSNIINLQGSQAIAKALKTNCVLTKLVMAGNNLGSDGAAALAGALAANVFLADLDIAECAIGDIGAHAIGQALEFNHMLTSLNLRKNRIEHQVVAISRALAKNQTLTKLSLAENTLTADGALLVAEAIQMNPVINHLNLASCEIQWQSIELLHRFQTALANYGELHLDLSWNNFDEQSYITLRGISGIASLHMAGSVLSNFFGHKDNVRSCALSADGYFAVSGGKDCSTIVWYAASGEIRYRLMGHGDMVTQVDYSADGAYVLSASADRSTKLWDAEEGTLISTLEGHSWVVSCCKFSPNGKLMATGSWDKTVKVWTMENATKYPVPKGHVLEYQKPKAILTLKGHSQEVRACQFSRDSTLLASASNDASIKIWDVATGEWKYSLLGHVDAVTSLDFSHDGRWMASASLDRSIKIWSLETWREQYMLSGHSIHDDGCQCVYSELGIATPRGDHGSEKARGERMRAGTKEAMGARLVADKRRPGRAAGHNFDVVTTHLKPLPEFTNLEELDQEKDDQDSNLAQAMYTSVMSTFQGPAKRMAASEKGGSSASDKENDGNPDVDEQRFSLSSSRMARRRRANERSRSPSPASGRRSQSPAGGRRSRSPAGAQRGRASPRTESPALSSRESALGGDELRASANSNMSSSGKQHHKAEVCSAVGNGTCPLKGHSTPVTHITFSNDSKMLMSTSGAFGFSDNTLKAWDFISGNCMYTLSGHYKTVSCCSFNFDSKKVLSASWDSTLRMWDIDTIMDSFIS
ncbi:hypothetical protein CYMTET_17331 [Cymbomonas tetramitiformis]|uniref:Leucine-rich repeat and WD repeat-containing protein 1 n=1 Tax=Cymbomonas tetramitiformis TaxID=36881 RepID=A0AAE0GAI6_9CHLO|nr:hypothetical protein CYMTET_17331 [Cymbomonas tetramitiformis]